jgi:short subunit dehydrogenase-like uncharacterized protein
MALWGADGLTGELTEGYLLARYGNALRFAIADRGAARLEA